MTDQSGTVPLLLLLAGVLLFVNPGPAWAQTPAGSAAASRDGT
jgi:hypothetical protein